MISKAANHTEASTLSQREKALVALTAYFALGKENTDLVCAVAAATKEGFTDSEVGRIKGYIEQLNAGAPKEEESLASLLASATKSSCCL